LDKNTCSFNFRILATGDSFRTIAFSYRLGHSTVQEIVGEVCLAIIKNMLSECIPTPAEAEWENIATKFLNLYLRKANFNTRKTYTDFRDWCDSSTTTGQLWVSFLTAYDSLLTPLFIITDRLMCTRVIAHFLTFKRLEKLYVTNRL
jgi:hypothetical protein